MLNGTLHNVRLDLIILEAFCNLHDSMITQYQSQKSYPKNYKPEIHFRQSSTLLLLWNTTHRVWARAYQYKTSNSTANSILDVFRRERKQNIQLFFKHMGEYLIWYFKGNKYPSYYRSYETGSFTQTYNVWRQKPQKFLLFKSSNLFRIRN